MLISNEVGGAHAEKADRARVLAADLGEKTGASFENSGIAVRRPREGRATAECREIAKPDFDRDSPRPASGLPELAGHAFGETAQDGAQLLGIGDVGGESTLAADRFGAGVLAQHRRVVDA